MKHLSSTLQYMSIAPLVLIGTHSSKINFTTIGDIAIMGMNPALLVIGLHKKHFVTQALMEEGVCSVNIPSEDLLDLVKKCSQESGHYVDKSIYFHYRLVKGLPLIDACPITMICEIESLHQVEQRCIFILKIRETWIDESINRDPKLIKPILYGLNDEFYSIGEKL